MNNDLNPLGRGFGDEDDGDKEQEEDVAQRDEMEELAQKYEKLKNQVDEYFDANNGEDRDEVPILKAPQKPTREQWERHQATHTPFAPWCKHCLAARNVRHKHPSKGRKAMG